MSLSVARRLSEEKSRDVFTCVHTVCIMVFLMQLK